MVDGEGMTIVTVEVLGNGYRELVERLQDMSDDGWHVEWTAQDGEA
jgi:hypothetical protein